MVSGWLFFQRGGAMVRRPACSGEAAIRYGVSRHGKPRMRCKDCGRQFTLNPTWRKVPDETIATIDRLLRERLSLRGIAHATGTSLTFVTRRAAKVFAAAPDPAQVAPPPKKGGRRSPVATRCGVSSATSSPKPGSGWPRGSRAGGSSGCTSAAAARRPPGRSGRACRPSTGRGRRFRPTPGRPTGR